MPPSNDPDRGRDRGDFPARGAPFRMMIAGCERFDGQAEHRPPRAGEEACLDEQLEDVALDDRPTVGALDRGAAGPGRREPTTRAASAGRSQSGSGSRSGSSERPPR